jgi:hypothetical protein
MAGCGYTPTEIDELTLHDVADLFTYWRDYPPAHEILKCVYRIEPKSTQDNMASNRDPSGIGGLITRFPDGIVRAEKV